MIVIMMSSSSVVFRTNIICPGSSRSITNTENWLLSGTKGMGYKLSSLLQLSDNLHKNISKWTGECRLEVIFWSHLVVGQRGAIKRMMMITVDRNTLRYWEERSPPRTKYHRNYMLELVQSNTRLGTRVQSEYCCKCQNSVSTHLYN